MTKQEVIKILEGWSCFFNQQEITVDFIDTFVDKDFVESTLRILNEEK